MIATEDKVHSGKLTKVERYGWTMQDEPGEQRMIGKDRLLIDHTYQRHANEAKLVAIAKDWSWVACGSIVVADREGALFVVDGQHRVMAARKRSDINALPCLVFKTREAKQEAKGFLAAQTQRKPITSVEKFRALLTVEDKAALVVQDLLRHSNRTAGGSSASSVKCLTMLMKHADADETTLRKLWPLMATLCDGRVFSERIVEGLMYIEKRMPAGCSLADPEWNKRVLKVGGGALLDAAARASAFYARGGAKVWAVGMVEAMNKGYRTRLEIAE